MATREKVVERKNVRRITTQHELKILMHKNNPRNEPVGILTGRCKYCGSEEVWANNSPMVFGCNCCGFIFSTVRA